MVWFSCCWFQFFLGILVGWVLAWWFSRPCDDGTNCSSQDSHGDGHNHSHGHHPTPTPDHNTYSATASANTHQSAAYQDIIASNIITSAAQTPEIKPLDSTSPTSQNPLQTSRADMLAAAAAAGISFKGIKNDLEIIEGIGPKIAGLMNDAGIMTFEDMSHATLPTLRGILDQAGPRYRMAKPDTWAQQATLAASGDWAGLKALQDSLDGGVAKN